MTLDEFNTCCAALPATHKVVQWGGSHVWKVGEKIFAIASLWGDGAEHYRIGFKASDLAFRMLTEQPDILPSPYLGRYKWVQLQTPDALSDDDLAAYIGASHDMVAAKLTKAKRLELGL